MGRIIRRTVTITITETVTITWATGDDPLSHPSTVVREIVPDTPMPKEEADELFHATLSDTPIRDPIATTPTPAAVSAAPADDVTAKPEANRQRKRKRRVAGKQ